MSFEKIAKKGYASAGGTPGQTDGFYGEVTRCSLANALGEYDASRWIIEATGYEERRWTSARSFKQLKTAAPATFVIHFAAVAIAASGEINYATYKSYLFSSYFYTRSDTRVALSDGLPSPGEQRQRRLFRARHLECQIELRSMLAVVIYRASNCGNNELPRARPRFRFTSRKSREITTGWERADGRYLRRTLMISWRLATRPPLARNGPSARQRPRSVFEVQ